MEVLAKETPEAGSFLLPSNLSPPPTLSSSSPPASLSPSPSHPLTVLAKVERGEVRKAGDSRGEEEDVIFTQVQLCQVHK